MIDTLAPNLIPLNDEQRLKVLHRLDILYTSAEEAFDNITHIMAQVFGTPMSFISLVDKDTVFYKSQFGPFGRASVLREDSLCSLTILANDPLVIEDASTETSLSGNPYVSADGGLRFYAGAPLITKDGYHIGTACIVDTKPRTLSEAQKELLVRFARMVMHEIEARQAGKRQIEAEEQLLASYNELQFVTDTMPQLVWATEPNGYSVYFNRGWLSYTGLSFDEVKGDGWMQSLHPTDHEPTMAAWRHAVETGESYDVEYRLLRHDGLYRWFVARGVPMKDDQGTILKWYGTSTDIHDQKLAQKALRQTKERFDLVSKATQDAIWDWNLLTDDVWWNEGFKELFGYNAEEIEPTSISWYNRVHPEDKERVVGGIHHVINNDGKQWSQEYRFRKKDGSYAIVFDRGYALHNTDGKPYRMLGSMQDITETKLQQEKIKQSEQHFQNLIREATVGIIVLTGEEMKVEVVNQAYSQLIDRQVADLLHQPLFSIIPEAEKPFRAFLNNVRESGQPYYLYDYPYRINAKDGPIEGYLNLVYQPYKEADGTTVGVMVLCQNVTDQVKARKKAEEAEETARLAITSAELGTFHVDLGTNHMTSSERLDEIFDVDHPGERNRYIESIHPEDRPIRTKAYEKALETGLLEYEGRIVRKNGITRWFRIKGRMSFDEHHQPSKIVGVAMDITEEKIFSEELARQVKERTQEMEQFTYVSHHDLQEPLRKITMFTEMVRTEDYNALSETSRNRLDKVTGAARRMSAALRDVLNFASLSKPELFTKVSLNEVLTTVQTDLELAIQEKNAKIQLPQLPTVQAIPQQMHQLFYNLLNNALKFSKTNQQPLITILCRKLTEAEVKGHDDLHTSRNYYQLTVQDNGIGFPLQASEKIFGLFQRLHTRDTYTGTGIGLALCKKVVTNHGGKIWAESLEGEGALFTIILRAD